MDNITTDNIWKIFARWKGPQRKLLFSTFLFKSRSIWLTQKISRVSWRPHVFCKYIKNMFGIIFWELSHHVCVFFTGPAPKSSPFFGREFAIFQHLELLGTGQVKKKHPVYPTGWRFALHCASFQHLCCYLFPKSSSWVLFFCTGMVPWAKIASAAKHATMPIYRVFLLTGPGQVSAGKWIPTLLNYFEGIYYVIRHFNFFLWVGPVWWMPILHTVL